MSRAGRERRSGMACGGKRVAGVLVLLVVTGFRRGIGVALGPLVLLVVAGCGVRGWEVTAGPASGLPFVGGGPVCVEVGERIALPEVLHESSGVAPSADGRFLWSHNDSGHTNELFALSLEGALLGRVEVTGAENVDWEDLAAGPCDDGAWCLYIADLGDNLERRRDPAIYRVREPDPGAAATEPAERFPIRLPHGPRDVEALYLLPGERLFFVTKGRNDPLELYRVPPLEAPGRPLVPERIQRLGRVSLPGMVTGAAATSDGSRVAIRSYETLEFFRPDDEGLLVPEGGGRVNLRPLREPQGEAVTFLDPESLVLTTEAGPGLQVGGMRRLHCPVPQP